MTHTAAPVELIIAWADRPEEVVRVTGHVSIGRSLENDIVVDDSSASRFHAEIRTLGRGDYYVSDLGSRNGTLLNGQPIKGVSKIAHGDRIEVGNVVMAVVFRQGAPTHDSTPPAYEGEMTALGLRDLAVVILVSDIRNYTTLTENLPGHDFQTFVGDWHQRVVELVKREGGTVDRVIGDAVMAYWHVPAPADLPGKSEAALRTALEMMRLRASNSATFRARFKGFDFEVGIGIHFGEAALGNLAGGGQQAFTLVGDCVNVAFRIESLTKARREPILTTGQVADAVSDHFQFRELGETLVKGRSAPVRLMALIFEDSAPVARGAEEGNDP